MLTAYVALVPEYPGFDTTLLLRVAAAIRSRWRATWGRSGR